MFGFKSLNQLMEADWMYASFPIIRIVMMVLIVLCALGITVCIMCMESNPEGGANVISGTNDSFYAQNQSSTREGRLKRLIVILSIILVVLAILFFVSYLILPEA
ncbi:MAG: preprotein translocase subunit SecG [Clostridiales bacterium]|nr:preprotein translocase subunit SecG [Candidatus Apopatousia equi]